MKVINIYSKTNDFRQPVFSCIDSVLTRKNMGQRKLVLYHILRSVTKSFGTC